MIISRTPFRISLGGGSTDLPAYADVYGGFIFGVSINMHMDIFVRQPVIYDRVDLQYLTFESVENLEELKHAIGREALKLTGINHGISVYFKADTPMGTGLGSSGSCAVGLLNALWRFRGVVKNQQELAEEAFYITQKLGLPDGRQDPYLAALGGFSVLEIGTDQKVNCYRPDIALDTIRKFLSRSLFFYTGVRRNSVDVLVDQSKKENEEKVLELKHRTKEIGRKILGAFISGDLDSFGRMMDEHWCLKKEMSGKISSPEFDQIYDTALKNGAVGGKLIGAGGGGYFLFYCRNETDRDSLGALMAEHGYKIIPLEIDYKGTRVVDIEI